PPGGVGRRSASRFRPSSSVGHFRRRGGASPEVERALECRWSDPDLSAGDLRGDARMETTDSPRSTEAAPEDLVGLIRRSGVLGDRQFEELGDKVRVGEYPSEARALAARLVSDQVLTAFQADRLLRNKAHGLVVGRYVILDRIGSGNRGRVFKA